MSLTLAIDQSTSATKAILFDATGNALAKAAREHRQIYPQPGWVEHEPEEIWANLLAVVRELAEAHGDLIQKIARVSLTNQRETILVFDRHTGRPLHNAIVWQCRRGDAICQQLNAAGHDDTVRRKTGLKIDTYFSASKLKWLIDEKPDIAAALRNGRAVIGTIDTFLIHRLTGGKTFATDSTNASRTLLYDVGQLKWDDALCNLFGVPMKALPEVRESVATFGQTDIGGALPRPVDICGVMGDSQASLFAQRCFTPGTAKATFGTGTSVMLNAGHAWKPPEGGAVAALAWVYRGEPTYALEGIINASASTLAWLKDSLGVLRDTSEAEAMATSICDNGGVYLVPAFAGLGAPHWAADARAAIVGMTTFTGRAHLVRAALESIGYQIRDVVDMMNADAATPLGTLRADGGPTRNAWLMQFVADITGVDIVVGEVPEASAWGATTAGLLGSGVYADFAAIEALPRPVKAYRPRMNVDDVARLYDGWRSAIRQVI